MVGRFRAVFPEVFAPIFHRGDPSSVTTTIDFGYLGKLLNISGPFALARLEKRVGAESWKDLPRKVRQFCQLLMCRKVIDGRISRGEDGNIEAFKEPAG